MSDSQALFFSPDLLPVNKNDASSLLTNSKVCLTNSFSLFSDSLHVFGLEIKQFYENLKRYYFENSSRSVIPRYRGSDFSIGANFGSGVRYGDTCDIIRLVKA